jgi:hypothetical protein
MEQTSTKQSLTLESPPDRIRHVRKSIHGRATVVNLRPANSVQSYRACLVESLRHLPATHAISIPDDQNLTPKVCFVAMTGQDKMRRSLI